MNLKIRVDRQKIIEGGECRKYNRNWWGGFMGGQEPVSIEDRVAQLCQGPMFEDSPDIVVVVGADGKVVRVNRRMDEWLGYDRAEIVGCSLDKLPFLDEQSVKIVLENFAKRTSGEVVAVYELGVKTKTGGRRYCLIRGAVIRDDKGGVVVDWITVTDITAFREAEQELKKQNELAQKYLNLSKVVFVALDKQGLVSMINDAGCELLGYGRSEIVGKNWFETVIPAHCREQIKTVFEKVMSRNLEGSEYWENTVQTKSGQEKLIAWHNAAVTGSDGQVEGTLSSGEDVTERRKMGEDLIKKEAVLEALVMVSTRFLSSDVNLWESNVIKALQQMGTTRGASRVYACKNAMVGDKLGVRLRFEWRADEGGKVFAENQENIVFYEEVGLGAWVSKLEKGEAVCDLVENMGLKEGVWNFNPKTRSIVLVPVFAANHWWGYLGIEDWKSELECSRPEIEALQAAAVIFGAAVNHKRIREQLSTFKLGISQTEDVVFITTVTGEITFVNPSFERIYGYSESEWKGKTPRILKSGQIEMGFYQDMWTKLLLKQSVEVEFVNLTKDKKLVNMQSTITPIIGDDDELIGFLAIQRDVTDRRRLESNLLEEKQKVEKQVELRTRELEEKTQALEMAQKRASEGWMQLQFEKARLMGSINSLSWGFMLTDMERNVLYTNPAVEKILGMTSSMWSIADLEKAMGDTFDWRGNIESCVRQRKAVEKLEVSFKSQYLRILISPISLMGENEEMIGMVILIEDVTAAKMLQKSRDEFFSVASHELRTPLTAIRGNASMIMEYYADKLGDGDVKPMLEDIHTASVRLIAIVNDFLDASRLELNKIEFKHEVVGLEEMTREVMSQLGNSAKEKGLVWSLENHTGKEVNVVGDKNRMVQVLTNLLGNAVKFTEKGGVWVVIENEGGKARIKVTDSGPGIAGKDQNDLFQKFKQVGDHGLARDVAQGAGMGLYVSRLLMEGQGGMLGLGWSEVGKGSCFVMEMPLGTK